MSVHIYDMCDYRHRLSPDLSVVVSHLKKSPLTQSLFDFAVERQVIMETDMTLDCGQYTFDPQKNKLILGGASDLTRTFMGFVAGLRRIWHFYQENEPDIRLKAYDFLKYHRCLEADIETMVLYGCWQLKIAGYPMFWRQYLSEINGDMGLVFLKSMEQYPEKQFNHQVLKLAYNQWHADKERVNATDHDGLELFDLLLCQHIERYCLKGDDLRISKLQSIGTLPFGGNYLETVRFSGKWYNGLHDPLNRAHLNHIEKEIN